MLAHKAVKKQDNDMVHLGKNDPERNQFGDSKKARSLTGSTHFWRRSLGNSYYQTVFTNRSISENVTPNDIPQIQRKCSCGGTCATCAEKEDEYKKIQTKLKIGPPNDIYEREADWVANEVIRMPEPQKVALHSPVTTSIQSQLAKPDKKDKDKLLQTKEVLGEAPGLSPFVESSISNMWRGGQGLSTSVRDYFERRFDRDFGGVRVHTDEPSASSAHAINARAYTFGNHIVFGSGQFCPHTDAGRRLLAHELVHVLQQASEETHMRPGRDTPNLEPKHMSVNQLPLHPMVQRDFALEPPHPAAVRHALTPDQMRAAIDYNNHVIGAAAGGADLIREIRDVLGTSPEPAVVDDDFIDVVLSWQAVQGLSQDGRLGPRTAGPLFREIGAEGFGKCQVQSGATYTPGAPVSRPVTGGGETAHFALNADFESDPPNGVFPSCCEVRQFIRWNNASAAAFGAAGVPHVGFPAGTPANNFIEDRDDHNNRYGHRSGPLSDPQNFDQYLDAGGHRDQAFGHLYRGSDDPTPIAAHAVGQWQFYLRVNDVCNRGVRVGGDDQISVNW